MTWAFLKKKSSQYGWYIFCKLGGVEEGVEAEFVHIFKLLSLVSKSSQAIGRRLLLSGSPVSTASPCPS